MSKILGIDLGTTNSCMAVMEHGEFKVIPNAEGNRTTPSIVAFTKTGERLVGQTAKRQAVTNPKNTIFSIKRLMGRKFAEVGRERELVPYEIVEAANGDAHVKVGDHNYSPPEISAMILQKLKTDAEAYLGEKITQAVITVPAYFNDSQRQATKDAGKIAGLEVLRIINEPTAAALAYGLDKKSEETVAVYDLGGGTFDISILEIGDGVFEVKATNGDTHLGGDDFDQAVINYLADEFQKENGVDLRKDPQALQRLKEAAEKAKCELSSSMSSDINLPFITMNQDGPVHMNITLTRAQLEKLCDPLLERTKVPCRNCMRDADVSADKIREVILVGGMTRMPKVQETAKETFNKEPHKGVNPDEVVAAGAAIQGGVPQIEVTFDIDANGILHVTAKDLGTGKEQKITITASSGLSDAEIERMVNEAKAHADDDKAAKDKIETKNHADSMVYQTEKQMKEFGDKIPADVKGQIESAIAKLKKEIEADNTEGMKSTIQELEQLLQKIGEAVYAAQQQAQQAGAAQGAADAGSRPDSNGGNDDGVVDAEVVDDK